MLELKSSDDQVLNGLAEAQAQSPPSALPAELARSLSDAVRKLSGPASGEKLARLSLMLLPRHADLASRIGDDFNLALARSRQLQVQDIVNHEDAEPAWSKSGELNQSLASAYAGNAIIGGIPLRVL